MLDGSFDVTAGAHQLALTVLAAPSPVSLLVSWSRVAPQGELAKVLHELVRLLGSERHRVLSTTRMEVRLGERACALDLLLTPSVFPPETWSATFLEGLLRRPLREYRGKRLVELGVGSGWISLALLRLTSLSQAIGVDLNPEAVQLANLNALLNGYDAGGAPRPDRLYDRFSAQTSDLLATLRAERRRADYVIGCIPQVIAASADLQSTAGLYDLSNYAIAQGVVEDTFGLGLNARALRDALLVLEPGGQVILSLASRPGATVITRMFERRGYLPEVVWRARIEQASDTDIQPLVELERRAASSFEFYLHRASREPVSAALAHLAQRAGHAIFHDLSVVVGKPHSEALPPLAVALEALALEGLWERVDLSRASDEQLRFVTVLAESFVHSPRAPYPHERGDLGFRQRVADFLAKFHGAPLPASEVFAAPSRASLTYSMVLALVEPGARVAVSHRLRGALSAALAKHGALVLWVHDDAAELAELLPALDPRLVILAPEGVHRHAVGALALLLERCQERGAMLVLDDSAAFEISSRPGENPILAFLAAHQASSHLAVMIGLIHSQAFPDVELALLLCRHHQLLEALACLADITYSRISVFHQAYYGSLFDELLAFRVGAAKAAAEVPTTTRGGPAIVARVAALLSVPMFARPEPAAEVLRLDYGENSLPMPKSLCAGILEGLLLPPRAAERLATLRTSVAGALRRTRLPALTDEQVVFGAGVTPLLFDAVLAEARRRGRTLRVGVAAVGWPVVPALLSALGAEVVPIPVAAPGFLLRAEALGEVRGPLDLLIVANPSNPSGQGYSAEALAELMRRAISLGGRVILDEVFGQLADLAGSRAPAVDRWHGLSEAERREVLILGGLSKELAAGGLRFGYAASADERWLAAMDALRLDPLPLHVGVAAQAATDSGARDDQELAAMRLALRERRAMLVDGLTSLGYVVAPGDGGGLFVLVEPPPSVADAEAFVLEREARDKVRFNTPSWSGAARHFRACFSVPKEEIAEALRRLRA